MRKYVRKNVAIVIAALGLLAVAFVVWPRFDEPTVAPRSDAGTAAEPDGAAAASPTPTPAAAAERTLAGTPAGAATAAAAAPAPEELWGRVVIAGTATPIARAEVALQHRDADEFTNLDLRYGEQVATLARAASGADGTFRFAVARGRKHRLDVRAAGHAPATVVDCTGGSEVVVGLSPGATVEGVVRCDGVGLVDVPVRIAVAGESIELAAGRTAPGGTFCFPGLQPASVFVQVCSPLHTEEWQRLELKAGTTHRAEIELKAGTALRGRVVEATTSAAIVDAEVSDSWTFTRIVRSDAEGRFVMPGLVDGSFVDIHVRAPGYASASRNFAGLLAQEAKFELVRGGEVTGRLVTADGVAPAGVYAAAGASYQEAPGMQGTDWIRADVDRNGRFAVLGLRPDQHYWLYVRGAGYGTRVHALARQLASGERLDVGDVVLRSAGGVEGRVVDETGEPIAGIGVSIAGANADSSAWLAPEQRPGNVYQFENRSIKTDQRGRFRFTNLAAGAYQIAVRQRGRSQSVAAKAEVCDGAIAEDIELVVATGAVIEGVLAYADGRTLGDEAAELYLQATREGAASTSARPEAGGRFRFSGLDEGTYTVTILRGPPGWSLSPRRGVATGTKDLQLVFERSSFVAGRVVDADSRGQKAQVYVRADGVTSGSALHDTDAEGRFRIEVPPDFHGDVGAHDVRDWLRQAKASGVAAGQGELLLRLAAPSARLPGEAR